MNELKRVKVTHEVINFRVPADLKLDFEWASDREERTISQQLRVLMLNFVNEHKGCNTTVKQREMAELNKTDNIVEKWVEVKNPNKRGK